MKNLFCVIILLSLISCASHNGRIELTKNNQTEAIQALDANDKLFDSFFSYSVKKIESNSRILISTINKMSSSDIKKEFEKSLPFLKKLCAKNKKALNNDLYNKVSLNFINIINRYDVGPHYNAYTCPMVNKRWVQNTKDSNKVKNPYADYMPHCGGQDTEY